MKAVILAAGEGSRLKPFTVTRPKVMIPVGDKPILEYVIDALQASGIIDIVMVVGYKREKIMDYFGDGRNGASTSSTWSSSSSSAPPTRSARSHT